MKSLIVKDLYNIGHNLKSMFFILLVFAFIFIPSSGPESYIFVSGILCSMMLVTTFTFDDTAHWTSYAMVTPITKKDLVISKFIVLLIFCTIGVLVGFIISLFGGIITQKISLNIDAIIQLFCISLIGLIISDIFGSMSIPLVFKFGAERGRMLLLISFVAPVGICFLIYQIMTALSIPITKNFIFCILSLSPLIAVFWNYIMYVISYKIFEKQEF